MILPYDANPGRMEFSERTRDYHHPAVQNYTVAYYKPANSPGLLAKNFPTKDDSRVPMTQAEFLEREVRQGACARVDRVEKRA